MQRGVSLLLLALAACGKEEPTAPPPPPPDFPAPPLPAPTEVAFPAWEDVDSETYLPLPDAPAVPLRWRFPEGRRFGYDFNQSIRQVTTASQGERTGSLSGRDRNGGTFEIVPRDGGRAGVLVTIESREAFRGDLAIPADELRKKGPSRFEVEMTEDGTASSKRLEGSSDAQLFFDLLLALREGGRTLEAGGSVTTRATGRRKVGRHECVRLETEMEAARPVGGGRRLLRARALSYFDPAEGRFIRASAVLTASQREVVKDEKGAWATRGVDSHSSFRVELLER